MCLGNRNADSEEIASLEEEFEIGFRSNRGETEFDARHRFCMPEWGCKIEGENCFVEEGIQND